MAFTPETADAFLKQLTCQEDGINLNQEVLQSPEQRSQIRKALIFLSSLSDYQTIGICADDLGQGARALQTYLTGLGYQITLDLQDFSQREGPVYLKYNTRKQSHYLDGYTGNYRGVLVSLQSDYAEGICGTYGHFPFDLFETEAQ